MIELPPPLAPEGGETCFNATDDNDNGLLDEGCGVHQGQVQFMAAWSERDLDVDLFVTDPGGQVARAQAATSLGFTLSADCPNEDDSCGAHPHENVYLEAEDVPTGPYQVRVRYEGERRFTTSEPLWVRLGVRTPRETRGYQVAFYRPGQDVVLEFRVARRSSETRQAERRD